MFVEFRNTIVLMLGYKILKEKKLTGYVTLIGFSQADFLHTVLELTLETLTKWQKYRLKYHSVPSL